MTQLPDEVKDFFGSVRMGCFPETERTHTKVQPWKTIWATQRPPTDGKLVVACPKNVVWGTLDPVLEPGDLDTDHKIFTGSNSGLGGY